MAKLRVDIVSDVVCPWCIIGYKQLEKALAELGDEVDADIYWHPFELNPGMPDEGQDAAEHIQQKYGSTPEQAKAGRARIVDAGAALGFQFNYGDGKRVVNTFKAHKLLHWAGNSYGPEKQTELKLAFFKAYFQDNQDVNDEAILLGVAESVGLNRDEAVAQITDEALTNQVRGEQQYWREQNISGVPALIFDQKFMVPGAQDSSTFVNVIRKVQAKAAAAAA